MLRNRKLIFLVYLLIMILPLSACGTPEPAPTNTPSPIPSSTITPTAISTLTPTITPSPTPVPVGALIAYTHSESGTDRIFTIDIDYGTQQEITSEGKNIGSFDWSPDGESLVYQVRDKREIYTIKWNGSEETKIVPSPRDGNYPVWSPDGTKIAFFSRRLGHWALFTMNPDGSDHTTLTDSTVFESIASWSPDGSQIVFNPWHNTASPPFIAKVNADGSNYTELTNSDESDFDPVWSPQEDIILFTSWRSGSLQIYRMNADGTEQEALTTSPGGNSDPVWSPDGAKIVFISWRDSDNPEACRDSECNFEIYTMNADGNNQTRITDHPSEDWGAEWSPDGKKIAFQSLRDEPIDPIVCGDDCNSEIYVMDANGSNVIRLTNNETPDWDIAWRP